MVWQMSGLLSTWSCSSWVQEFYWHRTYTKLVERVSTSVGGPGFNPHSASREKGKENQTAQWYKHDDPRSHAKSWAQWCAPVIPALRGRNRECWGLRGVVHIGQPVSAFTECEVQWTILTQRTWGRESRHQGLTSGLHRRTCTHTAHTHGCNIVIQRILK